MWVVTWRCLPIQPSSSKPELKHWSEGCLHRSPCTVVPRSKVSYRRGGTFSVRAREKELGEGRRRSQRSCCCKLALVRLYINTAGHSHPDSRIWQLCMAASDTTVCDAWYIHRCCFFLSHRTGWYMLGRSSHGDRRSTFFSCVGVESTSLSRRVDVRVCCLSSLLLLLIYGVYAGIFISVELDSSKGTRICMRPTNK